MEKLLEIPEVKEAFMLYGSYDIAVKLEVDSLNTIREVISNGNRSLPEVRSVSTMIIVDEKKKV